MDSNDIKDTYKNAWRRAFLNPLTLYPDFWKGLFGEWNETAEHARTDSMRDFNASNSSALPSTFKIKGASHRAQYAAIAADANIDGSTQDAQKTKFDDFGTITCGAAGSIGDECAANRSCKNRYLGNDVTGTALQMRYDTLQRLRGIKTSRVLGLSWWKVATMAKHSTPALNDFTVATDSAEHPRFKPFVWEAEENNYYLKNHTVAGRRWLMNYLASTILNVDEQGGLRP